MNCFAHTLLSADMFSNDSPIGMFLDRLGNDPTLQMLTAILVMLMAAAVIVFVVGRKAGLGDPPGVDPVDPPGPIEDPIPGWPGSGDDPGGSTSGGGEPGTGGESRKEEKKGPFKRSPDLSPVGPGPKDPGPKDPGPKDPGPKDPRPKGPDTDPSGRRTHGRDKETAAPEVEMFYTYKEPVRVRLCPYCGCENSFMAQRCECCGEDMLQRKGRYE